MLFKENNNVTEIYNGGSIGGVEIDSKSSYKFFRVRCQLNDEDGSLNELNSLVESLQTEDYYVRINFYAGGIYLQPEALVMFCYNKIVTPLASLMI